MERRKFISGLVALPVLGGIIAGSSRPKRLSVEDASVDWWNYCVFDVNTGMPIPGVQWADETTGEYQKVVFRNEVHPYVPGPTRVMLDADGKVLTKRCQGPIKLVHREELQKFLHSLA